MSVVQKALWSIERNLKGDLSLSAVAQAAGVSRHHLVHAFGAATGVAPMTYVRRRRLSEAAKALTNGAHDILPVALDAKYESQEAFSRAFKDEFGVTPGDVRKAGLTSLRLTAPLAFSPEKQTALTPPRFVSAGPLILVGLIERQSLGRVETIPTQWGDFMQSYEEVADVADEIPVGVSFIPDDEGAFDYACAVIVGRADSIPAGLKRIDLPKQEYALFEHAGHVSTIHNTYLAIWDQGVDGRDLADAPSLEKHKPAFNTRTGMGGVEIWIPLEHRAS
ncbi:MAG: AraC family transcriptional regulator [Alphaproteobacteria bacterium]